MQQAVKYEHIIFDLDGTLIDTNKTILKTWQLTLKEYGYEYTLEELEIVLGITTQKALEKLNILVNEEFEKRWIVNYQKFAGEADFFGGVWEMLLSLKASGYSLGVVTSRCRKEYEDYFRIFRLETIFDLIICADDTEKHKPDPEPLYQYARQINTTPGACIYVGDMPTDIECANNAGTASGLVLWNGSGIICEGADFIFHSPEELAGLFFRTKLPDQ